MIAELRELMFPRSDASALSGRSSFGAEQSPVVVQMVGTITGGRILPNTHEQPSPVAISWAGPVSQLSRTGNASR
jgi:hypothetical protein